MNLIKTKQNLFASLKTWEKAEYECFHFRGQVPVARHERVKTKERDLSAKYLHHITLKDQHVIAAIKIPKFLCKAVSGNSYN